MAEPAERLDPSRGTPRRSTTRAANGTASARSGGLPRDDSLHALQGSAGNRALAAALASPVIQRVPTRGGSVVSVLAGLTEKGLASVFIAVARQSGRRAEYERSVRALANNMVVRQTQAAVAINNGADPYAEAQAAAAQRDALKKEARRNNPEFVIDWIQDRQKDKYVSGDPGYLILMARKVWPQLFKPKPKPPQDLDETKKKAFEEQEGKRKAEWDQAVMPDQAALQVIESSARPDADIWPDLADWLARQPHDRLLKYVEAWIRQDPEVEEALRAQAGPGGPETGSTH